MASKGKNTERRKKILRTTQDLVINFMSYDRKGDEELPKGEIQEALEAGEITLEEIVETFSRELYDYVGVRRRPKESSASEVDQEHPL